MKKEEFMKLLLECLIEIDNDTSWWSEEGDDHFEEFLRTIIKKRENL